MTVLFANPPWWDIDPVGRRILGGVRGGGHRDFLAPSRSAPDRHIFGDYTPHPHLLASAAAYVDRRGAARVLWRDSIVIRESYEAFFNCVRSASPDAVVIASSSRSLAHDAKIVRQMRRILPRVRIVLSGDFAPGEPSSDLPLHAVVPAECELPVLRVIEGAVGSQAAEPLEEAALNAAPPPFFDDSTGHLYCDPIPHGELASVCPRFPQVHVRTARDRRRFSATFLRHHLAELLARFAPKSVYFAGNGDDLEEARLLELAALMSGFRIQWSVPMPAVPLASSTWIALRRSGCHGVRIAVTPTLIRSACPAPSEFMSIAENVARAKALGMSAHVGFLHAAWGESPAAKQAAVEILGADPACHSIQDHAPCEGPFLELVEIRTPRVETLAAA